MHDRSSGDAGRDPLAEILQDLRIAGVEYGHCRLRRPWGVEMPADGGARFHFVVSGVAWLRLPEREPLRLEAGDAALLPQGGAHALSDEPARPTTPLAVLPRHRIGERTYQLDAGGDGSVTVLSCCAIEFGEPALGPLRDLMPELLLVRRAAAGDALVPALLDALADEVMSPRLGSATVMTRLADVVVVRLFRAWAEDAAGEATTGWLAAMRDPRLGRALSAFHRAPEQPWTIGRLAAAAHMSRSSFCDRFAALVGTPPARYVARWRMRLAALWLQGGRRTIAEVADRLGYESEAAFSRAFKRMTGQPPSRSRRPAADASAPALR